MEPLEDCQFIVNEQGDVATGLVIILVCALETLLKINPQNRCGYRS